MNKHTSNAAPFRLYSDGLSTFLAIAADTIKQKADAKELTAADIHMMRNQTTLAAVTFGEAMETLAYACLDNTSQDSNTAPAALAMAAGFIREMAAISSSLDMAASSLKAKPSKAAEWPEC